MNNLFEKIKIFNQKKINEIKPIKNNINLSINQKLKNIYLIVKNDKLNVSLDSNSNNINKIYKQIKDLISNNFILSLLHNKDYDIWIQPIINDFIENNKS